MSKLVVWETFSRVLIRVIQLQFLYSQNSPWGTTNVRTDKETNAAANYNFGRRGTWEAELKSALLSTRVSSLSPRASTLSIVLCWKMKIKLSEFLQSQQCAEGKGPKLHTNLNWLQTHSHSSEDKWGITTHSACITSTANTFKILHLLLATEDQNRTLKHSSQSYLSISALSAIRHECMNVQRILLRDYTVPV